MEISWKAENNITGWRENGILSWDSMESGEWDALILSNIPYYVNGIQVGFVDTQNFTDPNQISDLNSSGAQQIFFIVHVMCMWMNWSELNRIDGWMDGWMNERTNKRMNKYNVEYNYTVCLYEYIHTNKPSDLSPNPLFYSFTTFGKFSFVPDAAILLAGLAMTAKPLRPTFWCFFSQTDWWYSSSFLLEVKQKTLSEHSFCWWNYPYSMDAYMKPILLVFEPRREVWVRIYRFCFHLQYPVPCT